MAALSAGALAPPAAAGLSPSPFPWCSPAPLCYYRRSPPLLKVTIAKTRPAGHQFARASLRKCAAMSEHGRQELGTQEYQLADEEPLWLAVLRDLVVGLKGLVAFLAEQPKQLKHLEWPGFQHTMKTATLTLVLVALFIVALSTIDAALCYMLAWLLRKSA